MMDRFYRNLEEFSLNIDKFLWTIQDLHCTMANLANLRGITSIDHGLFNKVQESSPLSLPLVGD